MNLRNALVAVGCIWLSLSLEVAQGQVSTADSPAQSSGVEVASPVVSNPAKPGNMKVFFTGYLLGYHRLPQWQSEDFQPTCPDAESDNAGWHGEYGSLVPPDVQTPALQFMNELKKLKDQRGDGVLVGMGDNFGVTLESRVYRSARESESSAWQLHPKSRDLKPLDPTKPWPLDPTKMPGSIGDNVGCFLSRASYDAIVPGKDDFYFGPERLRRIAARLAAVPESNDAGLHPVRMLGANLILKTAPLKKPPEIIDSDKTNLKFLPGLPSGVKSLDVSDNGMLLPFARQLRFQFAAHKTPAPNPAGPPSPANPPANSPNNYSGESFQPFLCFVSPTAGLDALSPEYCDKSDRDHHSWIRTKEGRQKPDGSEVWDFDLPQWAGPLPAHYGLCVRGDRSTDPELKNSKTDYYCLRITFAEPLFGGRDTPPYVVKKIGAGEYAVIFGIVDPDLATLVGRDNLSWRNEQRETEPGKTPPAGDSPQGKETYGTSVNATDPAPAIALALRHFDRVGRVANNIPEGAKIFKILLAEMERGKAETLAANLATTSFSDTALYFDLVFSSATDFPAATADQQVSFDPIPDIKVTGHDDTHTERPPFRQLIVVPWRAYDRLNDRLPDPLRVVTVTDTSAHGRYSKRDIKVEGHWGSTFSLPPTIDKDVLEKDYDVKGQKYLEGNGYWPPPEKSYENSKHTLAEPTLSHAFELAALDVVRKYTGADVALLQKRDFYWGPFSTLLNAGSTNLNGELLESILWMGDYLQVLTVRGDTLKKVLDDSDKLDALDAQTTNPVVESGRGLLMWGIQKTRDKQYLIDGTQLDPTRLYTVATSNHIGAGDTGYPQLADPQFADPRLPRGSKHPDEVAKSPRLSSIICNEVVGESCVENPELLFASIRQLPSQLEPTISARVHAWGRSFTASPELLRDGNSLADYEAQLRPTWRFSLKDFSLNLGAVRNNLSEVQRSTELAAVTEPSAGNAKGHKVDYSSHVEFVRSTNVLDEFVRGLTEYKSTVTGNTTSLTATETVPALPTVSRSKNRGAIDAGFFLHFPKHKYDSRYGIVLEPLHFETPLHREEVLVNTSFDKTTNSPINPAFILPLDRKRQFLSRLAVRAESSKSSVELGYQGGWERNALESITSNAGDCDELASVPLSTCLKNLQKMAGFNFSTIRQLNATRERNGAYVDLDWTIPMIWKLSLRTEDYGTYYRPAHLDNSTDTLYLNDAKETVKFTFPFLPNLALGPGLERIDYENKLEHVHLRTWGPVFSLTYNFDRYSGGNWKKSLGYSASTSGSGSK